MNERKDDEALKLKESSSSEGEDDQPLENSGLLDDEIMQDLESESLKEDMTSFDSSPHI